MRVGTSEAVYRFSGFTLDLVRGILLSADGEEIALRPKAFALLRLLVENAGRLLDRDTVLQTIWPETTVADEGLTQCVRDIRRALADDAQRIVKTVRKRGYTFAARVSTEQTAVAPMLLGRPGIAVLPFANLSTDPEQEYFSDGIADDIITELARNRSLLVIARGSSFIYRSRPAEVNQVARELGVRYLVEGSVRREMRRVRINARLIDAETGNHIWAERYDREVSDVFVVQDEITRAVIAEIQPAVSEAEFRRTLRKTPESLDAWEMYQRGLWHMGRANPVDVEKARELFQRAISADSMFAQAYAATAMTYMHAGLAFASLSLQETARLTIDWARHAVEIDPNDADTQAILAWTIAVGGINQESLDWVSRALATNPNSPWAHAVNGAQLLFSGKPSEARDALLMALRLDPQGPISVLPLTQVALSYYFERNYLKGAEAARRAVSRYPDLPLAYRMLAASLGQLGRTEEARQVLQQALAVSPQSIDFYVRNRPAWFRAEDHEHMLDGLRKAGWSP